MCILEVDSVLEVGKEKQVLALMLASGMAVRCTYVGADEARIPSS
jgi:hypothetical protein